MGQFEIYYDALHETKIILDNMLKTGILKDKRVIIFGANQLMCMCVWHLRKAGVDIDCIIDNDPAKQGSSAYGLKIISPQKALSRFDNDARILVGSGANEDMISQLAGMGYHLGWHILVALDFDRAARDYHFIDRQGCRMLHLDEKRKLWLNMLNVLDQICLNNGLRYFLGYGTMLGAVRHKGFIPWDDDCDVLIPICDLEKLTKAFESKQGYSLYSIFSEGFNYPDVTSIMADDSVVCDMYRIPQFSCGFPIDVYPLIGLPEDSRMQRIHIDHIKDVEGEIWDSCDDKEKQKDAINRLKDLLFKYDYDKCSYVTTCIGSFSFKDTIRKGAYEEYIMADFEDTRLRIPKGYDGFLSAVYGDYMTPPPDNKRIMEHNHMAYWRDA